MKHFLLATVGVLALGVTAANAADIQRRTTVTRAEPVYAPAPYNWTGGYIGINGGGAWGDTSLDGPFAAGSGRNLSGGLIGGTVGYNWQMGAAVFGLEADIDWARIRDTGTCGSFACETRINWLGTARGRLGYAMGSFMPYVTGGLAVAGIRNTITGFGSASDTKAGWTVGAGIEGALANNWTAKLEYLYVDLGHAANVGGSEAEVRSHLLRVGLNYRF